MQGENGRVKGFTMSNTEETYPRPMALNTMST